MNGLDEISRISYGYAVREGLFEDDGKHYVSAVYEIEGDDNAYVTFGSESPEFDMPALAVDNRSGLIRVTPFVNVLDTVGMAESEGRTVVPHIVEERGERTDEAVFDPYMMI